jgi:hypothetical protein
MMFAPVVPAAGVRPAEEVRTMLTTGFEPLAVNATVCFPFTVRVAAPFAPVADGVKSGEMVQVVPTGIPLGKFVLLQVVVTL